MMMWRIQINRDGLLKFNQATNGNGSLLVPFLAASEHDVITTILACHQGYPNPILSAEVRKQLLQCLPDVSVRTKKRLAGYLGQKLIPFATCNSGTGIPHIGCFAIRDTIESFSLSDISKIFQDCNFEKQTSDELKSTLDEFCRKNSMESSLLKLARSEDPVNQIPITGKSASLSIALHLKWLSESRWPTAPILVTGEIQGDGTLIEVKNVEEKGFASKAAGFKLIAYPVIKSIAPTDPSRKLHGKIDDFIFLPIVSTDFAAFRIELEIRLRDLGMPIVANSKNTGRMGNDTDLSKLRQVLSEERNIAQATKLFENAMGLFDKQRFKEAAESFNEAVPLAVTANDGNLEGKITINLLQSEINQLTLIEKRRSFPLDSWRKHISRLIELDYNA